eukprot:CAMPEP_0114546966 /NCGR_PEP_ID=MMETSP0114-20121206/4214_1 /TAXON_ID=31324 /ORGANISM="Goniomonas sp, Strain m" /LENGTH=171 /DNA_ID=CAMNT_0001731493 /DNA_START=31 /DNA_END=546 /DNA_ORIENTATION=-
MAGEDEQVVLRRIGVALDADANYVFDWTLKNLVRKGDKIVFMHCEEEPRPVFVGVAPPGLAFAGMPVSTMAVSCEQERHKQVDHYKEFLAPFIYKADQAHVPHEAALLRGDCRDALVDGCKELKIDTLVVGSRGLGAVKRAVLGSVSTYCVHHCHVPVVVVRHSDHTVHKG